MTDDEYRTKGMLLGMIWQKSSRCFIPNEEGQHGPTSTWYDHDTMEPVNWKQRCERRGNVWTDSHEKEWQSYLRGKDGEV